MNRSRLIVVAGLIVLVVVGLFVFLRQPSIPGTSSMDGEDIGALLASGQAYFEAGEYSKAIADLEAVVEANPKNSEAYFLLGQAYNRTSALMKAADAFNTVISLDPDNAAAHHNLGVTYYQLQDPSAALPQFQAALALDPEDADTHYQLGATYLTLALPADQMAPPNAELLSKAIAEFEEALALREGMPEALIGIGNVYLQQANYDAAIEALKQALNNAPKSPEANYALASAYAQSGDVETACETYQQFLDLNPPAIWKSQAEQAMMILGCE